MRVTPLLFVMPSLCSAAAQDVLVVPVVPEENATPTGELSQRDETARTRNHRAASDGVTEPERRSVNSEELLPRDAHGGETSESLLTRLRSADVARPVTGGSAPSVRFRAVRAFEPAYFWNGIPLSGAYLGAQALDVLPVFAARRVAAYPDSPPWWYPASGTAGAVDFITAPALPGDAGRSQHHTLGGLASVGVGSFGYRRFTGTADSAPLPTLAAQLGAQLEQSREDYPVRNNNGTVFRKDDDRWETRRNADYSKALGSIALSGRFSSAPGRWAVNTSGGVEERGLPGSETSRLKARLSRSILVSTAEAERISPESGAQQKALFGALSESATVGYEGEKPTSFTPLASSATSIHLGGHALVRTDSFFTGASGLSLFGSSHSYNSAEGGFSRKKIEAERLEGTVGAFQSWVPFEANQSAVSGDISGRLNLARSEVKASKVKERSLTERPLTSYLLSIQSKHEGVLLFARHSANQRRPWMRELFGQAGQVYPNPSLRAETTRAVELGAATRIAQLSCFLASDSDLIILDAPTPREGRFKNLDAVSRKGCLLDLEVPVGEHLVSSLLWSETRAEFSSPDLVGVKTLPRTPNHALTGAVSLERFDVAGFHPSTKVSAKWSSPYYLDVANQVLFSPNVRLDASLGVRKEVRHLGLQTVAFLLEALDLWSDAPATETDPQGREVSVNHSGFSGYPNAGRRFMFTLTSTI